MSGPIAGLIGLVGLGLIAFVGYSVFIHLFAAGAEKFYSLKQKTRDLLLTIAAIIAIALLFFG